MTPVVAFQGELGAYGDEAVERGWRGAAAPAPCREFTDVIEAVAQGRAQYGVLPIYNTIVGPIGAPRDLLAATTGVIGVDEIVVDVYHALLAPAGATLSTLTSVASHPVALAQCSTFLAAHPSIAVLEHYDTAGAARDVAARGRPDESAIASVRAARRYGLDVIAEGIQDVPENQTRFVVIARQQEQRS